MAAAQRRGEGAGGEEVDPRERFRAYRKTGDIALRNELVEAHTPLAASVAKRFARRGEPLDDLIQVANFGLVKAVERFDPEHGASFVSFAVPTMLGEIKRHFRDRTWSAKVPRSAKELLLRLSAATEELTSDLQRSPTVSEVAERLGVTEDNVLEAMEARSVYRPASLSSLPSDRGGPPRGETQLGVTDRGLGGVEDRLTVTRLLETLPERERRIVELRFYEDLTQSEIAAIIGISQMHVSRLLRQALGQLAARGREPEPEPAPPRA
ncbi:MAG: SigB/SigF/SigG family RNA polymerase sigma factor [Acidimicrobiia bacterium]|nr:SigB/SigF/SigG family RNA polymerase sigma factor [Acidimicrobiia bacterium]